MRIQYQFRDIVLAVFLLSCFAAGATAQQSVGQVYQGYDSAFLKSKRRSVDGFGTLMQNISAEQYKGNKVRLSGLVKSEEVTGWAGLWMRVDKGTELLAFDNMQKRPINGTTGWQLSGPGQV